MPSTIFGRGIRIVSHAHVGHDHLVGDVAIAGDALDGHIRGHLHRRHFHWLARALARLDVHRYLEGHVHGLLIAELGVQAQLFARLGPGLQQLHLGRRRGRYGLGVGARLPRAGGSGGGEQRHGQHGAKLFHIRADAPKRAGHRPANGDWVVLRCHGAQLSVAVREWLYISQAMRGPTAFSVAGAFRLSSPTGSWEGAPWGPMRICRSNCGSPRHRPRQTSALARQVRESRQTRQGQSPPWGRHPRPARPRR